MIHESERRILDWTVNMKYGLQDHEVERIREASVENPVSRVGLRRVPWVHRPVIVRIRPGLPQRSTYGKPSGGYANREVVQLARTPTCRGCFQHIKDDQRAIEFAFYPRGESENAEARDSWLHANPSECHRP